MACEKYSGWMTSAALGALREADEKELRAHVEVCDRCAREWHQTRALVVAVDRSVESLVAGEPSPQFAARLRAMVAAEPVPAGWPLLSWPRLAAVTLAAAGAMLLVLVVSRLPQRRETVTPIAANSTAQTIGQSPAAHIASTEPAEPRARVAPHGLVARAQSRTASLSTEVLVQRGQMSAAMVLSEGVSDGRIDGAQLSQLVEQSAQPIEVKELLIAPLDSPSLEAAHEAVTPGAGRN